MELLGIIIGLLIIFAFIDKKFSIRSHQDKIKANLEAYENKIKARDFNVGDFVYFISRIAIDSKDGIEYTYVAKGIIIAKEYKKANTPLYSVKVYPNGKRIYKLDNFGVYENENEI